MDLREATGAQVVRHPWELARFAFFERVLQEARIVTPRCQILDVGSGDAWFSSRLARDNACLPTITCWDHDYVSDSARRLGIDSARVRLCRDRPDTRFDLILLLDVLEHVRDDVGFLGQTVAHNLRPGGHLLISVPAWQQLYSAHDRSLRHHRRYAPAEFQRLLDSVGLHSLRGGGLFHSLLVPRALGVLRRRLMGDARSGDAPTLQWRAGPLATQLVTLALRADNTLSRLAAGAGVPLPGLSLWALCQQRSS